MRLAPVSGSRAWKWTIDAPASAQAMTSSAISFGDQGTDGASSFMAPSFRPTSMISCSTAGGIPSGQLDLRHRVDDVAEGAHVLEECLTLSLDLHQVALHRR